MNNNKCYSHTFPEISGYTNENNWVSYSHSTGKPFDTELNENPDSIRSQSTSSQSIFSVINSKTQSQSSYATEDDRTKSQLSHAIVSNQSHSQSVLTILVL
jgi:hypothetical protein